MRCSSKFIVRALIAFVISSLSACVSYPDAPAPIASPVLAGNVLQTGDGQLLAARAWRAEKPKAILVALHGMNDYSHTFAMAAPWWMQDADITVYAIDQRGFGGSPAFGRWVGGETLKADLRAAVEAARAAHPGLPIFVLGHSMGAAVIMAAEADAPLGADGLILAAPGVWGGDALPPSHRLAANVAATIAPGKTLTGERAGRQPTDNIEVLREMAADPKVIKETRLDAVLGVVRIMGEAFDNAEKVCTDALVLIGARDDIIPHKAMESAAGRLCGAVDIHRYPEGWHLLFRDHQREAVWRGVAGWIEWKTRGLNIIEAERDKETGSLAAPR
ncbi:MAG: alpha/beta fold hydrolase [Pseudomonadota bacterium]